MANLKDYFVKECVNRYQAYEYDSNGNKIPALYRRDDLYRWSKEAFEKGEEYFYCRPVDPSAPYGKLELCEPEYRYRCPFKFTEEEFAKITGNKDSEELNDMTNDEAKAAISDLADKFLKLAGEMNDT